MQIIRGATLFSAKALTSPRAVTRAQLVTAASPVKSYFPPKGVRPALVSPFPHPRRRRTYTNRRLSSHIANGYSSHSSVFEICTYFSTFPKVCQGLL